MNPPLPITLTEIRHRLTVCQRLFLEHLKVRDSEAYRTPELHTTASNKTLNSPSVWVEMVLCNNHQEFGRRNERIREMKHYKPPLSGKSHTWQALNYLRGAARLSCSCKWQEGTFMLQRLPASLLGQPARCTPRLCRATPRLLLIQKRPPPL